MAVITAPGKPLAQTSPLAAQLPVSRMLSQQHTASPSVGQSPAPRQLTVGGSMPVLVETADDEVCMLLPVVVPTAVVLAPVAGPLVAVPVAGPGPVWAPAPVPPAPSSLPPGGPKMPSMSELQPQHAQNIPAEKTR
jgi:hypothetical protein